ncbi:MAG: ABC transporter permease [Gemmatimonadaceae bacterium]
MSVFKGILARFRAITRPNDAESRMEEEFSFHVEMEAKRLLADGVPEDEARRLAVIAFGSREHHREGMRDQRGRRWLDDLRADVRFALRAMRRKPVFVVAMALTLGVGVGINGIIFGFVNSLLLRPLPAREPEQLVGIFSLHAKTAQPDLLAYDDYLDLRDRSGVFEALAGRTDGPLNLVVHQPNDSSGAGEPAADMVWGEFVTENYFSVLGISPALGRLFTAGDAPQGANPFAVLSYIAWQTRFHADSAIIGRVIRLNGSEFTIVGVGPPGFRGIRTFGFWPEIWAPIGMHQVLIPGSSHLLEGRGDGWMMVVGRMHRGWTYERTAAATELFAAQLQRDHPATNKDLSMMLVPASSGFDHPAFIRPAVLQLASGLGMLAAIITLLIVCANLANLQLARSAARSREIAIRLSLGCSRARLTRQLLVECVLLAIPGAALAVAAVYASSSLESVMLPHLQFRVGFDPTVDVTVLGYTAGAALLAVVLFGLVPALRASRPAIAPSLISVAGRRRASSRGQGMRASLVISQLAMSVLLLVSGMLFVRSLLLARAMDVGFDPDHRVLMSANLDLQGYDEARGRRFYRDVVEGLRDVPGVESASWVFPVPFDTYGRGTSLYVDGLAGSEKDQTISMDMTIADVDFVEALGLRLQAGRAFQVADSSGTPSVMMVSRQLATRLWPGRDPIGQHARVGGPSGREITVIGVVRDAKFGLIGETSQARVYLPLRQNYRGWQTLVVHSTARSASIQQDVSRVIGSLDPALPTFGAMTMNESVTNGFSTYETAAGIGGFFGIFALFIAAIGLYAIVAESVAERTREIGVRMALGATPWGVMRFVMGAGARLGGWGLGLGIVAAVIAVKFMRGLLYGLSPYDPLTFVAVPLTLGVVVLVATFLPARRAVRSDPVSALRSD